MKTPVDIPWIVRVRERSKLAYKVGTTLWYKWPTLTKPERSAIINGRKFYGGGRPVTQGESMKTKEEPVWAQFLPNRVLANTGYKRFKIGQVWAVCVSRERPYIFRVLAADGGGYFTIETLAGEFGVNFISEKSAAAEHSVLLFEDGELYVSPIPAFSVPAVGTNPCGEVDLDCQVGSDTPKPLTAVEICTKIMNKGEEHRKAGRNGQFSQVMVPMEDYLTLCKYFQVGEAPYDEVLVSTPIGIVAVYPVNPDGCTFTD
jgi:hypothetical protein